LLRLKRNIIQIIQILNYDKKQNPGYFYFRWAKPIPPTAKLAWLAGLFQAEANFTMDKRLRSKTNSPDYTPPPPTPIIKLEMVEKDLMEHVGECVGQKVKEPVGGSPQLNVKHVQKK
jgi:hypothetical protein